MRYTFSTFSMLSTRFKLFVVLLFIGAAFTNQAFGQVDTTINLDVVAKAKNPIIFGEGFIGGSFGFLFGGELNYQVNHSLFTARITGVSVLEIGGFIIPVFYTKEFYYEPALLYGYRYIKNGHSFSVSGGISYNNKLVYSPRESVYSERSEYVGFPFEVNYKLFKNKKTRYRIIYSIFPVGKPTAFGRGFGLKLSGNISKFSYLGFGLTYGFGYHKVYE
ncbi:hypothetical protein ABIB40_002551 [Pedobacter sp. UYP30]|uniref:hypothetical protein n=1 Tax=Pedobacter sp. UYP30 TaxID=1756400 RepID=UPI0033977BEA